MPKEKSPPPSRIEWIDQLRGIAIILMVIFHFCFDLRYFGWVEWNVPNGDGWWQFRYVILSIFIFTMGMSLTLAYSKAFNRRKFLNRIAQLAIAATLVTLMSLFMFPNTWIYFGIIHFLLIASAIGILFVKLAIIALIIGSGIILSYLFGVTQSDIPFFLFESSLPNHTEDFVPFFPWLGVCLIGVAAGSLLPLKKIQKILPSLPKPLTYLGRHGLVIYIIHQPIIFAVLMPLSFII